MTPPQNIESIFQSLNSPHFQVDSQNASVRLRTKTKILYDYGLTWKPRIDIMPRASSPCAMNRFQNALKNSPSPENTLQRYWKSCEPEWRLNSYNPLTQGQEVLRTDFEPNLHPGVRVIRFQLPNQITQRGLLFFKGPRRRPLVLVRPGIFSNLQSSVAERFALMQLFEEGPYHVLLLPSLSGSDYIKDNKDFIMGGFDEGLQTIEILKYLADPKEPLHQYISKVHLLGISLGGHGILFTHFLEKTHKKSLLDRTLLLCPAVDLKKTDENHQANALTRFFVDSWFNARLSTTPTELGLRDSESILNFIKNRLAYYRHPTIPWSETGLKLPDGTQPFWKWNDFWSWLPTLDYNNTMVIWTRFDPVVPPEQNSRRLSSEFEAPNSSLMELPRGLHCSLPASYQWSAISLTLRGFFDSRMLGAKESRWSQAIPQLPPIQRISIHNWTLVQREPPNHLKQISKQERKSNLKQGSALEQGSHFEVESKQELLIQLELHFNSIFEAPALLPISMPTGLSDQEWLLTAYNETLHTSIIREISSRLEWSQNSNSGTLFLRLD